MNETSLKRIVLKSEAVIYNPFQQGEISTNEDYIFLRCNGDVVTITPLMKEILEHARTPQTEEELVTWLSIQQHCSYEQLYPSVSAFLNRMIKFGAIVSEEEVRQERPSIFDEIEQTKKFDDFVLLERIGKNRSVAIYKCYKEDNPENIFSIKIMIAKESKRAFFKEAVILGSMPSHPNVRGCYRAALSKDKTPYLLLEYVDGKSISDPAVKRELPLKIKYKIGSEVMIAVHHLHTHGVLHGDIHASNFLVDGNHSVHLIDLGMAFKENEEVSHGGIPRYMPPERMPDHNYSFSKKKGDYVSEVFQIGICLYLLLSGKYPFDGLLLKDLANNIKNNSPAPLTETFLQEPIPPQVSEIVFKALEKDPAARYPSVLEMLRDWNEVIKHIKNGFPILQSVHGS